MANPEESSSESRVPRYLKDMTDECPRCQTKLSIRDERGGFCTPCGRWTVPDLVTRLEVRLSAAETELAEAKADRNMWQRRAAEEAKRNLKNGQRRMATVLELATARATIERLEGDLLRYGSHEESCEGVWTWDNGVLIYLQPCTCGYADALAGKE